MGRPPGPIGRHPPNLRERQHPTAGTTAPKGRGLHAPDHEDGTRRSRGDGASPCIRRTAPPRPSARRPATGPPASPARSLARMTTDGVWTWCQTDALRPSPQRAAHDPRLPTSTHRGRPHRPRLPGTLSGHLTRRYGSSAPTRVNAFRDSYPETTTILVSGSYQACHGGSGTAAQCRLGQILAPWPQRACPSPGLV